MNNSNGKIWYALGIDNTQLQADALRSMRIIRDIGNGAVSEGNRIDATFRKIGITIAGAFTLQKAAEFVKEIVRVRGEFQQLEISFTTMLQSKLKADKLMGELVAFAAKTPFGLDTAAQGAKQLLAYQVSVKELLPTLKRLGDISAGLNVPLSRLILVYGQVKAKGRLMGDDLRQFTEAGIPILEMLAKGMGMKDTKKVQDMVSAHLISFDQVKKVFEDLTNKGGIFFNLMEQQAGSVTGRIENLKDVFTQMLNEIGKENEGVIYSAISGAAYLVEHYKEVGEAIAVLIALYGTFKAAVIATAAIQGAVTTIQYTQEAEALMALMTAEQQAKISKLGLTAGTVEHIAAVRMEIAATVDATNAKLAQSRVEVAAASQNVAARRAEYLAARQLEQQRIQELATARATGTQRQIDIATRNLSTATTQRETAGIQYQNAVREFHQKKLILETEARAANTLVTNVNTASVTANVTATNLLTLAKARLIEMSKKLWAVIASNAWALAAVAVVALSYGIYKLITHQTEAEKAQKRLNQAVKDFTVETVAEQAEINRLFDKLRSTKVESANYQKVKDEIISKYGSYLSGLNEEIKSLKNVEAAYRAISAAARQSAIDRAVSKASEDAQKVYGEDYKKYSDKLRESIIRQGLKPGAADALLATLQMELDKTGKITDETRQKLEKFGYTISNAGGQKANDVALYVNKLIGSRQQLEKMQKQIARSFGVNTNEYEGLAKSEVDAYISAFESAIKKRAKSGNDQVINIMGQWIRFGSDEELNLHLQKLKDVKKQIEDAVATPATVFNKEYWEKIKKDAEEALEAMPTSAQGTAKWNELVKKIREANAEIKKYSTKEEKNTGAVNAMNRQLKAADELAQKEREVANERVNFNLSLRQKEVDLMNDSYEKEYKQIALNLDKQLQAVKEYGDERLKKQQDIERTEWESQGKKGTFSAKTQTVNQLPAEVINDMKKLTEAANTEFVKATARLTEREARALSDIRTAFSSELLLRTYEINRFYDDEVKKAAGNQEVILALERNRTIELMRMRSDFTRAAINREEQMLLARMEISRKFYLFQTDKEAEMLDVRLMAAEKVQADLKKKQEENPTDETKKDLEEIALLIDQIKKKIEDIPKLRFNEAAGALSKITGELANIDGDLGELFNQISNAAGQIENMTKEGASTGDTVTSVLSGLVTLINLAASAAKKRKEAEREFYMNTIALAHEYSLALNQQLRTQNELTGSGFITDYAGRLKDGYGALTDATNKYYEAIGKLSEGKAKISLRNAIDWGNVSKGAVAGAVAGVGTAVLIGAAIGTVVGPIGTIVGAAVGLIVGGLIGLFGGKKKKNVFGGLLDVFPELVDATGNLNKELAKSLLNTKQLDEKTTQLVQNALDWADAIEEANKQIKEIVTDLANDLGNSLRTAIVDAWKAGEDGSKKMFDAASKSLENFVEQLLYSTIFSDVFDEFGNKLAASLNPLTGDGDILDDYDWLMQQMTERGETYISMLDAVKKRAAEKGFNLWEAINKDEERKASSKGITSLSQDTGNEMNGRLTAVQGHTFQIAEGVKLLTPLAAYTMDIKSSILMVQAHSAQALIHLAGIETNTGRLESIEKDMRAVKTGIDDINLKGIKLKTI